MSEYINNLFDNVRRMIRFILEENGEEPEDYIILSGVDGVFLTRKDEGPVNPDLMDKIKEHMIRLDHIGDDYQEIPEYLN